MHKFAATVSVCIWALEIGVDDDRQERVLYVGSGTPRWTGVSASETQFCMSPSHMQPCICRDSIPRCIQ